jgi:serine protease Do
VGEPCGVIGVGDDRVSYTLNTGVVSAANRHRDHRFQFDGLVNYGNAGGPIFAADGRFLGIALDPMSPGPIMGRLIGPNDILEWQVAPNSGVSFGARTDRLRQALPGLKAGKSSESFGGAFVGFAPETTSLLDITVVLGYIVPGSPADAAGLRAGDTVRRFSGREIKSWRDILEEVDRRRPGDVVEVELERPGAQRYLELNGQRIQNEADLERLFQSLRDGATVSGRFVGHSSEGLKVKITLGER